MTIKKLIDRRNELVRMVMALDVAVAELINSNEAVELGYEEEIESLQNLTSEIIKERRKIDYFIENQKVDY